MESEADPRVEHARMRVPVRSPLVSDYIAFLFRPFFRAWWAALTGFASVLALFVARDASIVVGGATIALTVLVAFSAAFVVISVATQGWALFRERTRDMQVISFEKSKEVAEGWILVIEASTELVVGTVLDIHKRSGVAEVPLALVQIIARNTQGAYQATPIGKINPVHIREHANGGLRPADLIVRSFVEFTRIREVSRDIE